MNRDHASSLPSTLRDITRNTLSSAALVVDEFIASTTRQLKLILQDSDPLLWQHFGLGLGLGLLILLALSFFPGQPFMLRDKDFSKIKATSMDKERTSCGSSEPRKKNDNTPPRNTKKVNNLRSYGDNTTDNSNSKSNSSEWVGDRIPRQDLERIRKRFKLTPEQMELVMQQSRDQYQSDAREMAHQDTWTPHQRLNAMVYTVLIGSLIYVGNRDYGNIVTQWFIQLFPKEAAVLGLER